MSGRPVLAIRAGDARVDACRAWLCRSSVSSDQLYPDVVGVGRERLEVRSIPGQHGSSRFGNRDDHSINGGPLARLPSKQRCPARNLLGHRAVDHAGLEEPVRAGVAGRMPLEALHEHNGGNHRRPQLR